MGVERVILGAAVAAALAFPAPASAGAEAIAPDGAIYRAGLTGRYFHPLASFAKLNHAVTAGERRKADRLANSLIARGRRQGRFSLVWHYNVPGGRAGWTSGLAQAVAAQSLARAGRKEAARRAFLAIPNGLLMRLPHGPWIRLYGYSDLVVLNAQLQAALSIGEYARLVGDRRAQRLARDLRRTARALMPRFDTGSWSRYSLDGRAATLEYHSFVTSLLWKLSARQGGGAWRVYAARFRVYMRVPPELRLGPPPGGVAPNPDGFRDSTKVKFWLSKPALVTFRVAGDVSSQHFERGWKTWTWWPGPRVRPGRHAVRATATDIAGNATTRRVANVTVERDVRPPAVRAALSGRRLEWRASDAGSPWFDVKVERVVRGRFHIVELGRFARHGDAELAAAPRRPGTVALLVADSSGNVARVPLCIAE